MPTRRPRSPHQALPCASSHSCAYIRFLQGTIEFSSILYIPGMAPFDQQNYASKSRSIKLYVKRVFISDEFDESLMPR